MRIAVEDPALQTNLSHASVNGRSVRALTGKRVPLAEAFGRAALDWAGAMGGAADDASRGRIANDLWRALRNERPPLALPQGSSRAILIAERIASDRSIRTVSQAASWAGIEVRRLQRLFSREVGINPKEVIKRYRLQEATEMLLRRPHLACGEIAQELGYHDQAQFIRGFRDVVGFPPEVYRRRQLRS